MIIAAFASDPEQGVCACRMSATGAAGSGGVWSTRVPQPAQYRAPTDTSAPQAPQAIVPSPGSQQSCRTILRGPRGDLVYFPKTLIPTSATQTITAVLVKPSFRASRMPRPAPPLHRFG
jgi:hypothetical protein